MASNYTAQDQFNTVQIYDISDDVLGGSSGDANIPIKQLADRTEWLGLRTGRYKDRLVVTGNATIDADYLYHFIHLVCSSSNSIIQLPALSNFSEGDTLTFKAKCNGILYANIRATGSERIIFNSDLQHTETWMYDGEVLKLVVTDEGWHVEYCKGNFETVGECLDAYAIHKHTLPRYGTGINRADYPRLTWWITNKLILWQTLLDFSIWNSDFYRYKGCFHNGNGITTIGLPDDRGMFTRYLDQGRGVSSGRVHPYAGGYEPDEYKEHDHLNYGRWSGLGSGDATGAYHYGMIGPTLDTRRTQKTGGQETRSKNNAKIPLIRF